MGRRALGPRGRRRPQRHRHADRLPRPRRDPHRERPPMGASDAGHSIDEAAAQYERELQDAAPEGAVAPRFDITLLGVGPDGHTASLFPEFPQLAVTDRAVLTVDDSPKPPPQRLTLFPGDQRLAACVGHPVRREKASVLGLAPPAPRWTRSRRRRAGSEAHGVLRRPGRRARRPREPHRVDVLGAPPEEARSRPRERASSVTLGTARRRLLPGRRATAACRAHSRTTKPHARPATRAANGNDEGPRTGSVRGPSDDRGATSRCRDAAGAAAARLRGAALPLPRCDVP